MHEHLLYLYLSGVPVDHSSSTKMHEPPALCLKELVTPKPSSDEKPDQAKEKKTDRQSNDPNENEATAVGLKSIDHVTAQFEKVCKKPVRRIQLTSKFHCFYL